MCLFIDNDVRTKINNLRTYYSKELAKMTESTKSGAWTDDTYESKWPHLRYLSFLRGTTCPRKTTSTIVSI